jgi:hypothetical protein
MTWTLQGLWVSLSLAAALAAVTSKMRVGHIKNAGWIGLDRSPWLDCLARGIWDRSDR